MVNFLYSDKAQFIVHLILSMYVMVYYGIYIFEKIYEKNHSDNKYKTNIKPYKIIGYYYLIIETFFLIINIRNISCIYIIIHIVSSIIILTAMKLLKNK